MKILVTLLSNLSLRALSSINSKMNFKRFRKKLLSQILGTIKMIWKAQLTCMNKFMGLKKEFALKIQSTVQLLKWILNKSTRSPFRFKIFFTAGLAWI